MQRCSRRKGTPDPVAVYLANDDVGQRKQIAIEVAIVLTGS